MSLCFDLQALLQQARDPSEKGGPSWIEELARNDPEALAGMVIASVIALSIAAVAITKMWIRHRERLALIEKGMDPRALEEKPGDS